MKTYDTIDYTTVFTFFTKGVEHVLNVPELEKLLKDFYQISGMEIDLFDSKSHSVISVRDPFNNFCREIHRYSECTEICQKSDLKNLRRIKNHPNLLTYTCPFGFYSAFAPIRKNGEVIGCLTFAPGIEEKKHCDETPIKCALALNKDIDTATLKKCISNTPHYSKEKLDAYANILSLIAKEIESKELMTDNEENIAHLIKRYIDQDLSCKITLSDLSWKLHCSTVTLTEHFKKEYGLSIMQYVTKKRMELARQLLEEKKHSVSAIASLCGYSDVEYFSRSFKKYFGTPPSKFRK